MFVAAFLADVYVCLITQKNFVAAIAYIYGGGIHFIAVAKAYAMEVAPNHKRHRIGGTIGKATVDNLIVFGVYKPSR